MNKLVYISIIAFILSCSKAEDRACFKSSGASTTQRVEFNLNIYQVEINDNIDVTLVEDSLTYVLLTGPKNLLPFIEAQVENGRLKLSNENKCDILRNKHTIQAEVHASSFEYLNLSGYGVISNIDSLHSNITIEAFHSVSKVDLTFNCDSIQYKSESGSILVKFRGISNYLYAYNVDQAEFHSEELTTQYLHFNNSSIANMYGTAIQGANIEINSFSNVILTQNPINLIQTGNGTGEIIIP